MVSISRGSYEWDNGNENIFFICSIDEYWMKINIFKWLFIIKSLHIILMWGVLIGNNVFLCYFMFLNFWFNPPLSPLSPLWHSTLNPQRWFFICLWASSRADQLISCSFYSPSVPSFTPFTTMTRSSKSSVFTSGFVYVIPATVVDLVLNPVL